MATIPSVTLPTCVGQTDFVSACVCDARDAMWYFTIILEMILIAASVAENAAREEERKRGRTSFGWPNHVRRGGYACLAISEKI